MTDQINRAFAKRIAQGIGVLSLLMLIATSILAFLYRQTIDELIFGEFGFILIIFTINSIVAIVLALLVISRNSSQVIGWLFLAIGFLYSWWEISNFLLELLGLARIPGLIRPFVIIGGLAYLLPLMLTIGLVPLFFPDGRLPSRRWWPVLAIVVIGITGQTLAQGALDLFAEIPRPDNTGAESFFITLQDISEPILILGILGALTSLVVRFIRSRGEQRTRMKWLVYTAVMSISIMLLMDFFLGEDSLILGVFASAIPTFLTLAIGIAILRYRLYDIDIIIRRTLQYALLTAILAIIYFGAVVLLQSIVGGLSADSESPLIIVLSTLAIAALFNPLRSRIQDFIDHRFFRNKYDAEKALNRFAVLSRDEVDIQRLSGALLSLIEETIQPDQASLWLKQEQSEDWDRMQK